MNLSPRLASWANILRIFPAEISLILGNYAQKIEPFFAPLNVPNSDENGEPNGYDGVARRGIYERLLLSELALADEFEDEFIRRATMGEHLFLNLAKISPAAKRVSIAIFDAGAMQLGTPRIAHLAILIVLARRAAAAKATFLWGVLQDSKQLVVSDDTEASLKILLESRTASGVTGEDVSEWQEKLSDVPKPADVWLIGSEDLATFEQTKKFSHVYVAEVLEPLKRELNLKIKSASGAQKETTLELPSADVCTRLLRNPFETFQKPQFSQKQLGGNVTNFFFDQKGAKLFARLDSAEVLSFSVQNAVGSEKIYPTIYQQTSSEKYLAVGRLRKAVAVLSVHDHQTLRLTYKKNNFGIKEGLYQTDKVQFNMPANENDLLPIYSLRPNGFHSQEAAVLDAKGNLFLLSQSGSEIEADAKHLSGMLRVTATNVLAIAQTDREFIFVGHQNGKNFHRIISISDKIERRELPIKQISRAIFGRGERGGRVLALESSLGGWTIMIGEIVVQKTYEAKGAVVGVCLDSRLAPSSGLLELMDDQRTVEFAWGDGRRKTILTASEDITKIEFSSCSPVLAYQTEIGELILFSLTHRTVIGRYFK